MTSDKSALLIVDDEELVCRSIVRDFKQRFARVLFATDPDEAERILQQGDITNLICDYNLGDAVPKGTELLEKWRRAYPLIERAVIYTGTDPTTIKISRWVDSMVSKSQPLNYLYNALVNEPPAEIALNLDMGDELLFSNEEMQDSVCRR